MTKNKATNLPSLHGVKDASLVVDILKTYNIGNWRSPGGTDKEQLASEEQGPEHHSYGAVYQAIIKHLAKPSAIKQVLEIGIQRGGSLLLWQQMCPKAMVVGLDIEAKISSNISELLDSERVKTLWTNAYSDDGIKKIQNVTSQKFCLIIDDGPHDKRSQESFLTLYLPLLRSGGVAVIEDIQTEKTMKELFEQVPSGYKAQMIDRRNVNGRWDDLLLVIEKL